MGKVAKIGIKQSSRVKVSGSLKWNIRFTRCPPGDGEPPDPGWECHKPTERPGFRELDEYDVDDIGNEGDWG